MTKKANVHSFESFGTVDGPGVRYVIFFQGCHLKCLYCHNRDLWDLKGGTEYSADELFEEVLKYRPFFQNGGGVTASGGDPILQAEVIADLFEKCQKAGIHTVLDTSGAASINDDVKRLLSHTDLVLLDLKEMDDHSHRQLTGISNTQTIKMAEYLSEQQIPVWIRYVVVPGYTDSEEHCRDLAQFVSTLSNIEKVELLPFHKMGEFKWDELNAEYKLKDVEPPTSKDIERISSYFNELSIPVCSSQK